MIFRTSNFHLSPSALRRVFHCKIPIVSEGILAIPYLSMISSKKFIYQPIIIFRDTWKTGHCRKSYLEQKSQNQTKPIPHPLYFSKTWTWKCILDRFLSVYTSKNGRLDMIFLFEGVIFRFLLCQFMLITHVFQVSCVNNLLGRVAESCWMNPMFSNYSIPGTLPGWCVFSVEVSTGQSVYPLGASFPWPARPMGKQEGNPRIMEI